MDLVDLENAIDWDHFFNTQVAQSGHGFFRGRLYQRGYGLGNIFRGLFKILSPVVKKVGKSVGKQALHTGAQIAGDWAEGKDIKASTKRRAKEGFSHLAKKVAKQTGTGTRKRLVKGPQKGKGLGRRKNCARKAPIGRKKKTPRLGVQKTDIFTDI